MLFPVSLVYALVVHIRNYFFDIELFKSKSFETPTVCIGNLSTGGTGKTPMAELLISMMQKDYKVALLSRGYRRNSTGFKIADGTSTAESLGDEPYQIFSKFPNISVAVDADRRNGIRVLEEKISPDIIMLDDAFQHRKVRYRLSILLTAYGNLYLDDWYLPTGNLRDSKREARRADIIIVTKCPPSLNGSQQERIVRKLNPKANQDVLFSYLVYHGELKGNRDNLAQDGIARDAKRLKEKENGIQEQGFPLEGGSSLNNNLTLENLTNKKITLVTGIANPEPLVTYLEDAGVVFEHLRFRDHHSFTETDLGQLRKKELVLTTEKDYMRLKGKLENLYYLSIEHRFLSDGRKLLEDRLQDLVQE